MVSLSNHVPAKGRRANDYSPRRLPRPILLILYIDVQTAPIFPLATAGCR